MLNQVVLVGRITREPELKELEDGKKVSNITLAVPRSYKNADWIYETDFIDCTLWNGIANNLFEYCKKGDMVGVIGKIETNMLEQDGERKKYTHVVADKFTFIASKKKEKGKENFKEDAMEEITIW